MTADDAQLLREDIRELRREIGALSERFTANYVHRDRLDSVALAWERALTMTELRWDSEHKAIRSQLEHVGDDLHGEVDDVARQVRDVGGQISWAVRIVIAAVIMAVLATLGLTAA